jgi:hypothetical protein
MSDPELHFEFQRDRSDDGDEVEQLRRERDTWKRRHDGAVRDLEARRAAEAQVAELQEHVRLAQSCLGLGYPDISPAARCRIFQARKHLAAALASSTGEEREQ